jgi:hypothetical protein
MRCTTLHTHSIINTHPKTKCVWCKRTVKQIIEDNENKIIDYNDYLIEVKNV